MLLFKLNFLAMMLQSEVGFDLRSMWASMGWAAKAVVVLLAIMSAWSIGVMIDRYIAFSQARRPSDGQQPQSSRPWQLAGIGLFG